MPNDEPILQIYPQGLTSLLELKGDNNPSKFARTLIPQMDLTEWLLSSRAEIAQGTTGVALAVGNTLAGLTIPSSEWWWVESVDLQVAGLAAGENATIGPSADYGGQGLAIPLMSPPTTLVTGSATAGNAQLGGKVGRWLPPGTRFFASTFDLTGTGTSTLQVIAARMKTGALP